jgi:hypothetical protein
MLNKNVLKQLVETHGSLPHIHWMGKCDVLEQEQQALKRIIFLGSSIFSRAVEIKLS